MTSKLLKAVRRQQNLEKAWHAIKENARTSKSDEVRREVDQFNEDAGHNLRSIWARLAKDAFRFQAARGVPISKVDVEGKRNRSRFRPIVIAPVENRIVQRALLEILCGIPKLEPYFKNAYSFGGLRKYSRINEERGGVPAAVQTILQEIGQGARFGACADIAGFFTKIQKTSVINIISEVVQDDEFIALLSKAIKVELSNLAALQEKKDAFPIEDIGVAQGNSLSPLLGNIILHDFDRQLNSGDCRCVRYIDDFLILAPTRAAALVRLKKALQILHGLGMELSPGKSSKESFPLTDSFDFLGIEFANGLIRPTKKAITKLMINIDETLKASEKNFFACRNGRPMEKTKSLVSTLKQVDGKLQGWGKHYRFCNDEKCFASIDRKVAERIGRYLKIYRDQRNRLPEEERWAMLGIEELRKIARTPLQWPTRAPQTQSRARQTQ